MAEYVTIDSGERKEFESGMRRDTNAGKPRYDLIDGSYLRRLAMLMGRGAEKYGDNNWRQADSDEEYRRFRESAYRHFQQWFYGEDRFYFPSDEEDPRSSQEDHAAAVAFNVAAAEWVGAKINRQARYLFSGPIPQISTDELFDLDKLQHKHRASCHGPAGELQCDEEEL